MSYTSSDNGEPSKLMNAFLTFGDIVEVNILWIICCLPIITIGASTTAMYTVCFRLVKQEAGSTRKDFFRSFKANFKKATTIWIMFVLAAFFLYFEMLYGTNYVGGLALFYFFLASIESMLMVMVLAFLFPLVARYDNTVLNTIKNSFLLSLSNFGSFLKIFVAWFFPVFISIRYPSILFYSWFLWPIFMCGLIAFGTSHTILKVFDKISDAQKEQAEKEAKPDKDEQKKIDQKKDVKKKGKRSKV